VVKQAVIIIEAEQQRTDDLPARHAAFAIAKTADDAIGASMLLDLLHAFAVSKLIGQITPLGDDAIAAAPRGLQPLPRATESLRLDGDRRNRVPQKFELANS
jgi:hypothetical protein